MIIKTTVLIHINMFVRLSGDKMPIQQIKAKLNATSPKKMEGGLSLAFFYMIFQH